MDPVIHFELPCNDRERLARFFETAFGWKAQLLGPEMGNYTIVVTAESDAYQSTTRASMRQARDSCINRSMSCLRSHAGAAGAAGLA